jgi:hypothetical protein
VREWPSSIFQQLQPSSHAILTQPRHTRGRGGSGIVIAHAASPRRPALWMARSRPRLILWTLGYEIEKCQRARHLLEQALAPAVPHPFKTAGASLRRRVVPSAVLWSSLRRATTAPERYAGSPSCVRRTAPGTRSSGHNGFRRARARSDPEGHLILVAQRTPSTTSTTNESLQS